MKNKKLNAYWANELSPADIPGENQHLTKSTQVKSLDVAVTDTQSANIEAYRKERAADNTVVYPVQAHHQQFSAIIAEMDYFLTASGVRA